MFNQLFFNHNKPSSSFNLSSGGGSRIMATSPPVKKGVKKHPGKAILAGGIAGGIEICITFPTEYVKTQLQLQDPKNPHFKGIGDCVLKTVRNNGFFGLYTGLSSLFYLSIPKTAVRFLGFEMYKNQLCDENGELTKSRLFLSGLGAGVTEAIFAVCPMETIKVRFIHDQTSGNPRYRNFIHGIRMIVKEQGLGGIYKGLFPTILKQGSNQAIRFLTYGEIKNILLKGEKRDMEVWEMMLSGGIAGAASVFGNTPIDVIKTKMQGLDAKKYKNSWECVQAVWQKDGIKGFYKGTIPRLGRVCLDVAIVMTLYEKITQLLDSVWDTTSYGTKSN